MYEESHDERYLVWLEQEWAGHQADSVAWVKACVEFGWMIGSVSTMIPRGVLVHLEKGIIAPPPHEAAVIFMERTIQARAKKDS